MLVKYVIRECFYTLPEERLENVYKNINLLSNHLHIYNSWSYFTMEIVSNLCDYICDRFILCVLFPWVANGKLWANHEALGEI